MRKIWLVASATYWRRVRSSAFLVLTFGLPLVMVVAGAVPFWLATREQDLTTLGVVDQTGELASRLAEPRPADADTEPGLALRTFADIEAATVARTSGAIDAFLVIPPDYFMGARPVFYGTERLNARLEESLDQRLRHAQLPDAPAWLLARLAEPSMRTYVAIDRGVSVPQGPPLLIRIFFPGLLGLAFALVVFTSAGQMGAAMVREKDQRALEMVITSLSVRELLMGKVLGMSLLSLTQMGLWMLGAIIATVLALFGDLSVEAWSISGQAILWAVLLGVPGYLLYAVLGAGLGIIAGDGQQAQQLAGMLSFFGLAPLWLLGLVAGEPNGPLAVALSLFPLTAPTLNLFRMALTTVPTWQLTAALGLILVSLFVSIWFVARIFRSVMLLYGQRIRPRQVWQALRSA